MFDWWVTVSSGSSNTASLASATAPSAAAMAEFEEVLREEMADMRVRYEAKIRTLEDKLDSLARAGRQYEDATALPLPTPRR